MPLVNGLHFNNLRGDIYGGLTAAVVALPLAMAMGVASGVGPIAGMYGAIFVGFFAAIFGGTPAQVSGPTGPMTVVMAAIFTQYTGMFPDDPVKGATVAFTVVVMGGAFLIVFGLLRIGKYIELVPHTVVSGFMTGIGVIIILLQIGPLVGEPGLSNPLASARNIPQYLSHVHNNALMLSTLVLALVYGIPRFLPGLNRMFPAPLFALIAGTVVYQLLMPADAMPVIGDIPTGFPDFIMPVFEPDLLLKMTASALTLAGLGAIDSLLTSLVADNITRSQHKSDRELIGQGIGNMMAGLFGGLPGAGATMRTVVNVNAGGRTPLSGALHALVLLAIVLGAGSLAEHIPKAVLAGILIKVGTDIIDWDYLKRIRHAPRAGIVIMLTVFIVTVTIDLLLAVGIGMVMASFLFMHRMTQMQIEGIRTIQHAEHAHHLSEEETAVLDRTGGRILVFQLSGPMSFSSAKAVVRRHASASDYDIMLLDLSEVTMIDFTSSRALEDIITDTLSAGRKVLLVGVADQVYDMLDKMGVTRHFNEGGIYPNRLEALNVANSILNED